MIGGQMLENGCDVDEIVQILEVSLASVKRWRKKLQNGHEGLLRKQNSGRTSKLTDDKKAQLRQIIRNRAVAHGFCNEQWAGKQVRWGRFFERCNKKRKCHTPFPLRL